MAMTNNTVSQWNDDFLVRNNNKLAIFCVNIIKKPFYIVKTLTWSRETGI